MYPNRKSLKVIFGHAEKIFEWGYLLPGSKLKPAPHLKQISREIATPDNPWGSLSNW